MRKEPSRLKISNQTTAFSLTQFNTEGAWHLKAECLRLSRGIVMATKASPLQVARASLSFGNNAERHSKEGAMVEKSIRV